VLGTVDERVIASVDRLLATLAELGVEAVQLGQERDHRRIAEAVLECGADSVELYLGGRGGVPFLRALLRELIGLGRRDVSIVVHRVPAPLSKPGTLDASSSQVLDIPTEL
jgi:hypothetical protein